MAGFYVFLQFPGLGRRLLEAAIGDWSADLAMTLVSMAWLWRSGRVEGVATRGGGAEAGVVAVFF